MQQKSRNRFTARSMEPRMSCLHSNEVVFHTLSSTLRSLQQAVMQVMINPLTV